MAPLSFLSAIEHGQTVSFAAVLSSCDCPFDCEGDCADPIVEIDNSSASSSSSGDSPVCFDLSYIGREEQKSEQGGTQQSNITALLNDKTNTPEKDLDRLSASFRDIQNDESVASSKSEWKSDDDKEESDSSSSSGSSMPGWDLSHLCLDDDDASQQDQASPVASTQHENAAASSFRPQDADGSQVIDLLDDCSESDHEPSVSSGLINVDSSMNAARQDDCKQSATLSTTSARNEYAIESSEEEWEDECSDGNNERDASEFSNQSPSVIILSDSDEDIEETWLHVDDENVGQSDTNTRMGGAERFARKPFSNGSLHKSHDATFDKRPALIASKVPRTDKGESKAAFRKRRELCGRTLFSQFNMTAFDGALQKVEVVWSNKLRTTAGLTRLKKRSGGVGPTERIASIELSSKIIDEELRLRSTLLHEMCHAAAWLVDGVSRPPHGSCFKKWANIAMRKVRQTFFSA